jgi:hypothetical protein
MVVREEEVMTSTPAGAPTRPGQAPPAVARRDSPSESGPKDLGWAAFCARFFPDRRRHDLEALTAYANYKHALDRTAPQRSKRAAARQRRSEAG